MLKGIKQATLQLIHIKSSGVLTIGVLVVGFFTRVFHGTWIWVFAN